jgi:uncharacterized protein (TIGR02001 family)
VRVISGSIALLALVPVARAGELHGYLTLGSDYVFRGISQTNGDPTVQGGIDYAHENGLFAGLFAADVDFPDNPAGKDLRQSELDLYAGYGRAINRNWAWDAALIHYEYPDSGSFDYAYDEIAVNFHYRDMMRIGAAVSDNAISGQESGWIAEIEIRHPLGDRARLSGTLGHYTLQRSNWRDYAYWDLGVSTTSGPVTVDLRYFDADEDVESFAGARRTRSRLVVSLSVGF